MSWFSGIGCFDLALIRAGFERVGACEIDPFARKVYAARLGTPAFFPRDITAVTPAMIPDADVWVGGFPCQDVSVAGARRGLNGTRSGLVFRLLDLAAVTRPEWLLLENVPGLLSGSDDEDAADGDAEGNDDRGTPRRAGMEYADEPVSWFGVLLGVLADCGYRRVGWQMLDARWFGVAQRRRRVFILAEHESVGDARNRPHPYAVLSLAEGVRRNSAARGKTRPSAAGRAAGGAGGGGVVGTLGTVGRRIGADEAAAGHAVVVALSASDGGVDDNDAQGGRLIALIGLELANQGSGGNIGWHVADKPFRTLAGGTPPGVAFVKQGRRSAGPDGSGETWGEGPAPTLNANENHTGTRATELAFYAHTGFDQAIQRDICPPPDGRGRGPDSACRTADRDGSDLADTIDASVAAKRRFAAALANGGVRRLTPGECEALMALPRGWTCLCGSFTSPEGYDTNRCTCPDGPRYGAIGNGGVTHVVEWIGRRLAEVAHAKGN